MALFCSVSRYAALLAVLLIVGLQPLAGSSSTVQVPAGSSDAITAQTQTAAQLPETPEGRRIFRNAQSSKVRDTLQAAIDSDATGR